MTAEQSAPRDTTDIEGALGRMVYQAASLEMVMRFAGEMLALTEEERDALASKTAGRLLPAVENIAAQRSEITSEELTTLGQIVKDAQPHLTSRNTYIHGAWGEVNGDLLAMNRKPKNRFRTRPLAVADLETLSTELQALVNRTVEWTYEILQKTHAHIFTTDDAEIAQQPPQTTYPQVSHLLGSKPGLITRPAGLPRTRGFIPENGDSDPRVRAEEPSVSANSQGSRPRSPISDPRRRVAVALCPSPAGTPLSVVHSPAGI
ncbi:hypothetical protein [Streptomyces jumonjinensis]|uniref:hypothetical protein n=1 Tax=Streptomyces jumonjinensis TaxID=1945 RepID=UPI0037BDA84E